MSWVRSCYTTKARWINGQGLGPAMIWYFTAPGAQVFPDHHTFGSADWQDHNTLSALGEGTRIETPHPWRNGNPPFHAAGLAPDGPVDWFQNGIPAYQSIPRLGNGMPVACFPGIPGLLGGGSSLRLSGPSVGLAVKGGSSNAVSFGRGQKIKGGTSH